MEKNINIHILEESSFLLADVEILKDSMNQLGTLLESAMAINVILVYSPDIFRNRIMLQGNYCSKYIQTVGIF